MKHGKLFLVLGALLALIAVVLGAFGAHGLEGQISPERLDSFETGVRYQMYHALALVLVSLLYEKHPAAAFRVAGWLFVAGVLLFSISIYLLATRNMLGIESWTFLGPITPIGGSLMIIGWVLVLVGAIRNR